MPHNFENDPFFRGDSERGSRSMFGSMSEMMERHMRHMNAMFSNAFGGHDPFGLPHEATPARATGDVTVEEPSESHQSHSNSNSNQPVQFFSSSYSSCTTTGPNGEVVREVKRMERDSSGHERRGVQRFRNGKGHALIEERESPHEEWTRHEQLHHLEPSQLADFQRDFPGALSFNPSAALEAPRRPRGHHESASSRARIEPNVRDRYTRRRSSRTHESKAKDSQL
ncbi:MAG: hypothetical protein MHM6MM_002359 [Cercozoa sp. M6MM]